MDWTTVAITALPAIGALGGALGGSWINGRNSRLAAEQEHERGRDQRRRQAIADSAVAIGDVLERWRTFDRASRVLRGTGPTYSTDEAQDEANVGTLRTQMRQQVVKLSVYDARAGELAQTAYKLQRDKKGSEGAEDVLLERVRELMAE